MYSYCLFCQTQKAKTVASMLEKRGIHRAFTPQIMKRQRVKGRNVDMLFDMLPGYVFVYSETKIMDYSPFRGLDGVIRRLGTLEGGYLLSGADEEFARRLYDRNGVIGQITVFKVGDRVALDDPLFSGCDGKITSIDYRKQRARVDYQFAGMDCFTWIACDLLNAAPPEQSKA